MKGILNELYEDDRFFYFGLLVFIAIAICAFNAEIKSYEPKSLVLASVKHKGIVIRKEEKTPAMGFSARFFTVTIKSPTDIDTAHVSEEVFNLISQNDTIK